MVTTNDEALATRLLQARNHGLRDRNTCAFWSLNSRLDDLQAALLRVQLRRLDAWTEERRRLAHRYHELLHPYVEVPTEGPEEFCVYQTYMVQVEDRDALAQTLNESGVEARVHYPLPLHLQPVARPLGYGPADCPEAVRAAKRILSLPLYPGLTDEAQRYVADVIAAFYHGRRRS